MSKIDEVRAKLHDQDVPLGNLEGEDYDKERLETIANATIAREKGPYEPKAYEGPLWARETNKESR